MKRKINHYLIIDGYNIINAWDELKEIAKYSLEDSRDKLIHYMIDYAEFTGKKAIIVFDAYNIKNSKEKIEKRKHITLFFLKMSQRKTSAITFTIH